MWMLYKNENLFMIQNIFSEQKFLMIVFTWSFGLFQSVFRESGDVS